MDCIQKQLFKLRDEKYKNFSLKLLPTINPESVIGVRTPDIRRLAKELYKNEKARPFLDELPHRYYEENNLHGFIIEQINDFDTAIFEIERFLPYIDSWATCDCISISAFKKNTDRLYPYIEKWIKSGRTYTVRFGIISLMRYYLDEKFDKKYLETVSKIKSDEYYINMAIAWFFATALAKQYDSTIHYLTESKLDKWVHNKTIQKSIESYRISDEKKKYLKALKK